MIEWNKKHPKLVKSECSLFGTVCVESKGALSPAIFTGLPLWLTHPCVFNVARSVTPDTGRLDSANHCITSYSPAIVSVETWPPSWLKSRTILIWNNTTWRPQNELRILLPGRRLGGRKTAALSLLSKCVNTYGLPPLGFQNENKPRRDAGNEGNMAERGHLPVVFLCHLSLHLSPGLPASVSHPLLSNTELDGFSNRSKGMSAMP